MNEIFDALLPIAICVILPIAIVLIVTWGKMNADNKRASILMKAIESDRGVDTDKIAQLLSSPRAEREGLPVRSLRRGCLYTLIGFGLALLVGIMALNDSVPGEADSSTFSAIGAVICLAVGISNLVVYYYTRRTGK